MSLIASTVQSILEELFPANPHKRIYTEYYVRYKNQKLFFDFHIKELSVLVEVQGLQHIKFVKHFHGTAEKFQGQKFRDNLKIEWCTLNNMSLIRIYDTEEVNKELILHKINKAMETGFYE